MQTLRTYDPDSARKYNEYHARLPDIWKQAVAEKHETGRISPQTKAEYVAAIQEMRRSRMRQFKTPADVAKRIFNIMAGRAYIMGEATPDFPKAETFETLRDVRHYYAEGMQRLREARKARLAKWSVQAMPVMPKGEGEAFNGNNDFDGFTQAFSLPDVAGGVAFIVSSECTDDMRYIAITSRKHPESFEVLLPAIATRLMQRLFVGEDPQDTRFFVHYPSGYGRDGAEQYWAVDLRPDAWGRFHIMGRLPLPMVPYGIANMQFVDKKRVDETELKALPPGFDPYIEAWAKASVAKQEAISKRLWAEPKIH